MERLFESVPKARILRLFLRNPEDRFQFSEIVGRSRVRPRTARAQLNKLIRLGLVHSASAQLPAVEKRGRKTKIKKAPVYFVNMDFDCLKELRELIAKSSVAPRHILLRQIKGIGKVKLVVLSGIFINNENARIDLLIVGDDIQKRKLDVFLANTESDIGKPIQHTIMDTEEFRYRMDMYDRFLRDILEYPHEKLINKLNI